MRVQIESLTASFPSANELGEVLGQNDKASAFPRRSLSQSTSSELKIVLSSDSKNIYIERRSR